MRIGGFPHPSAYQFALLVDGLHPHCLSLYPLPLSPSLPSISHFTNRILFPGIQFRHGVPLSRVLIVYHYQLLSFRAYLFTLSLSLSLSLSSDCLAVRVSRVASCSIVPVSFDKRHAHVLFSPSRLSTSLVYYPTLYPLPVCVCSCVSSARHVRYTLS